MKLLPVGSVVRMKDEDFDDELYIISSNFHICERIKTGEMGYFEYRARRYPYGEFDDEYDVIFNSEDIAEVLFVGYENEEGATKLQMLAESVTNEYRKFTLDEFMDDPEVEDDNVDSDETNKTMLSFLFNDKERD